MGGEKERGKREKQINGEREQRKGDREERERKRLQRERETREEKNMKNEKFIQMFSIFLSSFYERNERDPHLVSEMFLNLGG